MKKKKGNWDRETMRQQREQTKMRKREKNKIIKRSKETN